MTQSHALKIVLSPVRVRVSPSADGKSASTLSFLVAGTGVWSLPGLCRRVVCSGASNSVPSLSLRHSNSGHHAARVLMRVSRRTAILEQVEPRRSRAGLRRPSTRRTCSALRCRKAGQSRVASASRPGDDAADPSSSQRPCHDIRSPQHGVLRARRAALPPCRRLRRRAAERQRPRRGARRRWTRA